MEKVFISFSVNDNYNYANPSNVVYGNEFFYDVYCIHLEAGSWLLETLYKPTRSGYSDNYGFHPAAILVDGSNNIHVFGNRYGWYSYGGEVREWIRAASSNTWGAPITVLTFTSGNIDTDIFNFYRPVVDSSGTITLILERNVEVPAGTDDELFYVRKTATGTWSAPTVIDTGIVRSYAGATCFDAAIDQAGHIYLVYYKNQGNSPSGKMQVLFSTDFGTATPIYTSATSDDRVYEIKLHGDASGNLTAFMRRSVSAAPNAALATRPAGGSWSAFSNLPTVSPDGDVWYGAIVRTDTQAGQFSSFMMTYMDRVATGGPPYGPDLFYFYKPTGQVILEITMNQATYQNGDLIRADEFRLKNTGTAAKAVELGVWLSVPGIEPIGLFNLGWDGSFVVPAGFDLNFGPLSLLTVIAAFPRGQWEFSSRMVHPTTKELLSEDLNPFTVQ